MQSKKPLRILLKGIMAPGQINDHSQFLNFGITVCQRKSNWAGCLGSIRSLSNRQRFIEGLEGYYFDGLG